LKPEDPDKPKAPDMHKATLKKSPTKKLAKNPSAPAKKKRKWWQIFK
jgi:hypothetical protein